MSYFNRSNLKININVKSHYSSNNEMKTTINPLHYNVSNHCMLMTFEFCTANQQILK